MFRGLILGIIWGGLLAAIVLGMASLIAPLPATVAPQTTAASGTLGALDETTGEVAAVSKADDAVAEGAASAVTTPSPEDQPLADTASAPKPETGGDAQTIPAPEAGGDGSVPVTADDPVTPLVPATSTAPGAAVNKDDLSITTNPDQPSPPPVPEVGAFPETPGMTAPEADDSAELKPAGTGAASQGAEDTDKTPTAERGNPPAPGDENASVLKPAGNLKDSFPDKASKRLPTVIDDATEDAAAVESAEPMDEAARPIDRFSQPFDNPDGKPLMSILLMDDGSGTAQLDALESFPYPLTFAIDTLSPDATRRAAAYRDRGFEVVAMIDIPAGAAPSDVEVALGAHLQVLPEAVAVMEGMGDGLQGNRDLSDQVSDVLLATGHGLILFPQGLDTARKLAQRDGVPAATVFRDFDSKNQTATVIRRFLDQAAFRAGQEGGVIMVGRLREETIAALLLWALQDRATTVALAPVSAVLLSGQ
ncbi:polysaccharide deacteylase family 2 protein [Shimia biformata]|uniref:polysaccharide deacteylase family 2 protein n=1 Tax=Shimia biformata TaxID=1294299 RepID=UPI00195143A0|nr:polysaccharide deacteylase family 2 protein [Shimia biformata]